MAGQLMTFTDHELAEFSRMAQAAYRVDRNDVGHRFSMAAATLRTVDAGLFDALKGEYRAWLVFGKWVPLPELCEVCGVEPATGADLAPCALCAAEAAEYIAELAAETFGCATWSGPSSDGDGGEL